MYLALVFKIKFVILVLALKFKTLAMAFLMLLSSLLTPEMVLCAVFDVVCLSCCRPCNIYNNNIKH